MYSQVFMGAGDSSQAQCHELVKDLMKAFDDLCSLQQGGMHYEYERTQKEIEKDKLELEKLEESIAATAAKIYLSLTGCKSLNYCELVRAALNK